MIEFQVQVTAKKNPKTQCGDVSINLVCNPYDLEDKKSFEVIVADCVYEILDKETRAFLKALEEDV